MFMNILVGLMVAVAVIAGIWGWWSENHGKKNSNATEDSTTQSK